MSTPLIVVFALALALVVILAALVLRVKQRSQSLSALGAADASNGDRQSIAEYYLPMTRILDASELEVARELAGERTADFERFRRARIMAFQSYLSDMRLDFHRIEFKMHYLLLSASQQEADLVGKLNSLKAKFRYQLLRIEIKLIFFRLGIGTIEIEPLVLMLQQFEENLMRRPALGAAAA